MLVLVPSFPNIPKISRLSCFLKFVCRTLTACRLHVLIPWLPAKTVHVI
jgi:hypothetical protein